MVSNGLSDVSFNRGTGLLIIEARYSNPNGDPDAESEPRAYFGEVDHAFRSKAITDVGPKRSRVSLKGDHPFRSMASTLREGTTGSVSRTT